MPSSAWHRCRSFHHRPKLTPVKLFRACQCRRNNLRGEEAPSAPPSPPGAARPNKGGSAGSPLCGTGRTRSEPSARLGLQAQPGPARRGSAARREEAPAARRRAAARALPAPVSSPPPPILRPLRPPLAAAAAVPFSAPAPRGSPRLRLAPLRGLPRRAAQDGKGEVRLGTGPKVAPSRGCPAGSGRPRERGRAGPRTASPGGCLAEGLQRDWGAALPRGRAGARPSRGLQQEPPSPAQPSHAAGGRRTGGSRWGRSAAPCGGCRGRCPTGRAGFAPRLRGGGSDPQPASGFAAEREGRFGSSGTPR